MANKRHSIPSAVLLTVLTLVVAVALVLPLLPSTISARPPTQVQIAPGDGSLLIRTDQLVVAPGDKQARLNIYVRDAEGKAVADTVVTFSASLGQIEPVTAQTDNEGRATASFRPGTAIGQARVSVAWNGLTEYTYIQIGDAAESSVVPTVSLSATAAQLQLGQQTKITVTVRDEQGRPLSGVPVVLFGSYGDVMSPSTITDTSGQVTTTYIAGSQVGEGRVTALVANNSATITITITKEGNDPGTEQEHVWLPIVRR